VIGGYSIAFVSSTQPVRIRLRFASFDALIDKFAPNITRGGVFIASRTPLPIGSTFAFEIQLAGGEVALAGDGKVTWVKPFDPAAPQKPHGMGVQFLRLDNPSRELLNKILARKAATAAAAGPGAAARASMPLVGSGAHRIGTNGTAQPKIDTSVDLASEFGVDEARLRRAIDRNWLGANRVAGEVDELENLLKPEPIEQVSIAQALVELPRLLSENGARVRRMSGAFRSVSADKPEEPR
jgi:uncharacterized protein (TIGR02266 family)